jgi:hypothetical protein
MYKKILKKYKKITQFTKKFKYQLLECIDMNEIEQLTIVTQNDTYFHNLLFEILTLNILFQLESGLDFF